MTDQLGYKRFGAHGGDWGSTVTEQLARSYADSVAAIHLTDVPFGHLFQKPDDPSAAEEKFFKKNDQWMQKEGAYALIQSDENRRAWRWASTNRPLDSLAWMVEKVSRLGPIAMATSNRDLPRMNC